MTSTPTTQWRNVAHGRWFAGVDWTAGVPDAGTAALFGGGQIERVSLAPPPGGSPATADSLLVHGDALTLAGGALALTGGTTEVKVDEGGTLTLGATASVTGTAEVEVGAGISDGQLVIRGTLVDDNAVIGGQSVAGVLVSGPAAHWSNTHQYLNLSIGGFSALLTIAAGGTVDVGPNNVGGVPNMSIGNMSGHGMVVVRGAGSTLIEGNVNLGNGSVGTLEIRNGGTVIDNYGIVGEYVGSFGGDGHVLVTGAGSEWRNLGGIQIGKIVPVVSSLTILDHGRVSFGDSGMLLHGYLTLDPTATLTGTSMSSGTGSILAVAGPDGPGGTVTIGASLQLFYNAFDPNFTMRTFMSSTGGTTLAYTGLIHGTSGTIAIGAGHVALINPGNTYGRLELFGGVVELGANGAAGVGGIDMAGSSAEIQLDTGVTTLANMIYGFSAGDLIDIEGIAGGKSAALDWHPNSGGGAAGGTLTVGRGGHALDLHFTGTYDATSFKASGDGHGGTVIRFA